MGIHEGDLVELAGGAFVMGDVPGWGSPYRLGKVVDAAATGLGGRSRRHWPPQHDR